MITRTLTTSQTSPRGSSRARPSRFSSSSSTPEHLDMITLKGKNKKKKGKGKGSKEAMKVTPRDLLSEMNLNRGFKP